MYCKRSNEIFSHHCVLYTVLWILCYYCTGEVANCPCTEETKVQRNEENSPSWHNQKAVGLVSKHTNIWPKFHAVNQYNELFGFAVVNVCGLWGQTGKRFKSWLYHSSGWLQTANWFCWVSSSVTIKWDYIYKAPYTWWPQQVAFVPEFAMSGKQA